MNTWPLDPQYTSAAADLCSLSSRDTGRLLVCVLSAALLDRAGAPSLALLRLAGSALSAKEWRL